MPEALRDFVVSLSLKTDSFSRNIIRIFEGVCFWQYVKSFLAHQVK